MQSKEWAKPSRAAPFYSKMTIMMTIMMMMIMIITIMMLILNDDDYGQPYR